MDQGAEHVFPLSEATADTLNDYVTPNQRFLREFRAAEDSRAAKLRALEQHDAYGELHVKHPVKSDIAIFGNPHAAVHALLPNAHPEQVRLI